MAATGGKINLILGSHAHVPYGAAEPEFAAVYANVLKPFLSNLFKYPHIQAALHYSGVLLNWVERSHTELFMLIEDMVGRKQVEILGGGFYEPLFPLIPVHDKIGQIELLTTYIRRQFGKRPQGCWIPAMAWEQNLVSPLASCGISYTFLSERQFSLAGFRADDMFAPCLCEDQGKLITVFPVLQSVEAAIAGKSAAGVLEEVKKRIPAGGDALAVIFPQDIFRLEGETPYHAWNRFFEELSLAGSFVECVSPAKALKGFKTLRKASFPDSLGLANGQTDGNAGGHEAVPPRRFLTEHPEANGIYTKMIFTNVLIGQLRGDKARKQNAREELWKAQGCGLFCTTGGHGLYRHTLRKAAYRSLLEAERISREKGKFSPSLLPFDFNLDGAPEYLFQDARLNCYVQTQGAGVFELDYIPKTWNYLDTLAEALEEKTTRRKAAPSCRSTAFADRLLPPAGGPGAGGVRHCCLEIYEPEDVDRSRRTARFVLSPATQHPFGALAISKTYTLRKDTLSVQYRISNQGEERQELIFSTGIPLSFPGEGDRFVRFFKCRAGAKDVPLNGPAVEGAESLKIHDLKNEVQIMLCSTRPFDARLETIHIPDNALSPEAAADQYQSNGIHPFFPLSLAAGEIWENEFSLKFSH
jgi:hypothetical protein